MRRTDDEEEDVGRSSDSQSCLGTNHGRTDVCRNNQSSCRIVGPSKHTERHAGTSRDPGRVNLDELLDQRREVLPGELLQCLASVHERDPRERMARTGNASLAALRVIRSMFCTTQSIQPSVLSASSLDSPYQVGTTAGVRPCPCKPSSLQRGKAHSAAPSTRDPSAEVRKAESWGLPIRSPSSRGCTACGP